jgi:hypothetical protein
MIMSKGKITRRDLRPANRSGALRGLLSSTVTTPRPPEPPDFIQTTARAGLALIPGIGGALQVIYEDVRVHMAARQWQTIQEIADNVGEDRLAARLKDPVHQALFANGVEVATRTGLEDKRRLLAKVVSAAILNDAALEGAQLRVEALRDLDVPQIRALERLQRLLNDHKEENNTYLAAVQQAWKSEPHPIRAALTRTGVAFTPRKLPPTNLAGYTVDGIT